jgi:hypothetical protein
VRALALCLALAANALWIGAAEAAPEAAPKKEAPASPWIGSRGLTAEQIGQMATGLRSDDPKTREHAARALSQLHAESLPGIVGRLAGLRHARPSPERVTAIMTALRHAVGSKRADDRIDRASGVLTVLARERDGAVQKVIEPLLLMRSLERIATRAAQAAISAVLVLDGDAWDHEARLLRERQGMTLLPGLIALRSHEESRVRNWAQQGVRALGMDDPAVVTSLGDSHLVAQAVLAYSEPLDFQAMPVLVRLVASDKLEVRMAARTAVQRFGRNAIWQLRTLYEEVAGQRASTDWDAERTASELYAVLDRSAVEEADTLLAQGMAHLVAGRLDQMQVLYDRLLALFPLYAEQQKLAPGYAALGDKKLADDQLIAARDALQRALRLDPKAVDEKRWRAQLAYTEAELSLSRGVLDLHLYEQALAYDPEHEKAARTLDRLSGAQASRERTKKKVAAGAALALLLAGLVLGIRTRRRDPEGTAAEA